jgi:hypothetical protein
VSGRARAPRERHEKSDEEAKDDCRDPEQDGDAGTEALTNDGVFSTKTDWTGHSFHTHADDTKDTKDTKKKQ